MMPFTVPCTTRPSSELTVSCVPMLAPSVLLKFDVITRSVPESSDDRLPSLGSLKTGLPTSGNWPGSTARKLKNAVVPSCAGACTSCPETAVYCVIVPSDLSWSKTLNWSWRSAVKSLRTEMSPPLPSRTLSVSPWLTISPTSCSETIAITPTATQKMASTVRWPPRRSERVA
jgi:hypothetical protein